MYCINFAAVLNGVINNGSLSEQNTLNSIIFLYASSFNRVFNGFNSLQSNFFVEI